jgi:hypothetical protein
MYAAQNDFLLVMTKKIVSPQSSLAVGFFGTHDIPTYMGTFISWLERRAPAWATARQYAASLTDPVVLRRVQREMETEDAVLRRRLGMKRDGRRQRRGL